MIEAVVARAGARFSSDPWEGTLRRVESGDVTGLLTHLVRLDAPGRKAVAARLPDLVRATARDSGDWQRRDDRVAALRLAGAACLGGAADVATWLNRRDLRLWRGHEHDAERLMTVLGPRDLEWRADLARRLTERLRATGDPGSSKVRGEPGWHLAAALVTATGIEPPANDAFVLGWVWALNGRWRGRWADPAELAGDPLLDFMVPRLLSAQRAEVALRWDERQVWPAVLCELVRRGRIERRVLLESCLSRFIAGGDERELRPATQIYRLLETTPEEVAVRDLVRLLPVLPGAVAKLAAEELERADRAGRVSGELFGEAAAALAFRAEKTLVRKALTWIAKALPSRAAECHAALATTFGQDDHGLRERAVKLAVKLAGAATPSAAEEIREAAATLPADLRAQIVAAYGEVGEQAPDEAPALPAPPPPRPFVPLTGVAEVVSELTAFRWSAEPETFERLMAGLVEHASRDPEAMAAWRTEHWPNGTWWGASPQPAGLLISAAIAITDPADHTGDPFAYVAPEGMYGLVLRRLHELCLLFRRGGSIPVLLATPTDSSGHLDPDVLVSRMERYEATGAEPLAADFEQALLRLPAYLPPPAATRARSLTSPAGRTLAGWLDRGGLPQPVAHCGLTQVAIPYWGYSYDDEDASRTYQVTRPRATTSADLPGPLNGRLSTPHSSPGPSNGRLPTPHPLPDTPAMPAPDPDSSPQVDMDSAALGAPRPAADASSAVPPAQDEGHVREAVRQRSVILGDAPGLLNVTGREERADAMEWWAWTLPSHAEVQGARLLTTLAAEIDQARDYTIALAGMAQADGRIGPAAAYALACGLGFKKPDDRLRAVDALLTMAARDTLPARDLGQAVADLVTADLCPLTRIATALTEAARAGAHHHVWTVLETALPALLPGPGDKPRAGLPALLALAVSTATLTGAKTAIPGLAEVAARRGTSRFVQEARRLQQEVSA